MKATLRGIINGVKNMYNNVEKFVLVGVILCVGSLLFLMEQTEQVQVSDNSYTESFNEDTVDVEITSLVDNTDIGSLVNDDKAMTTEAVSELSINSDSSDKIETTPTPSFNDAFLAARDQLGPGNTFEWNGNLYSTNYVDEVINTVHREIVVEDILIDETEPQLSQINNEEENLALNNDK